MKNKPISNKWASSFAFMTFSMGLLGLLSLIPGWEILGSFKADYLSIPVAISISFVLMGASLMYLSVKGTGPKTRYVGTLIFAIISLVGIFCLIQNIIKCPFTVATLILSGGALLLVYLRKGKEYSKLGDWAGGVSSVVNVISTFYIFSYIFKAPFIFKTDYMSMGATSAIGFFIISASIICLLWHEHFPGKLMSGNETRAILLRSFMPISILFVLIGALIFKLTEVYSLQTGNLLSFFLVGFILILVFIYSIASRMIGKSIDSSEMQRRIAESELLMAEKKFRIIFDNSEIGIALLDKEGRSIMSNPALQKMLGYSGEELQTMVFTDFTHPDDAEIDRDLYSELINGEINSYNIEKRYCSKEGETIWGNLYVTLDRDSGGNPIAVIGMVEDITERKNSENRLKEYSDRLEDMVEERTIELYEAQEQLVRKERLAVVGEMAGGISHELRNPLGSISNAAYYLKMVLTDVDENIIKYIDIISREVTVSENIITSLLDYAKIKPASQDKCEIKAVTTEVLSKIEVAPEIVVTENIPADIPAIFADRDQIKQVLINLVINAVQAMPDGGELEISAEQNKNHVNIKVRDTGIGIKEKNMKKLFEPLFSTKSKGIGLGLALSQKITEANGGEISVESEEGVGTTFTLSLLKD